MDDFVRGKDSSWNQKRLARLPRFQQPGRRDFCHAESTRLPKPFAYSQLCQQDTAPSGVALRKSRGVSSEDNRMPLVVQGALVGIRVRRTKDCVKRDQLVFGFQLAEI